MSPALSIDHLTKHYGRRLGVRDVSFEVAEGEVVGFLGPNGAGKTTVIRMLLGLISIDSGTAAILGQPVDRRDHRIRRDVGYLPGTLGLYKGMRVGEYFDYLARLRRRKCRARIDELCERLKLDARAPIDSLSKGTRQKVGVVQALMHGPRVLVLDEPTSGLDPIVQREFENLLAEEVARGCGVLLSSHVMSEVERVASRVAIIDGGHLLVVDTVEKLKTSMARRLRFAFDAPVDASAFDGVRGVREVSVEDSFVDCVVIGAETSVLERAVALGVRSVESHEPSLGDVFFEVTRGRDA